MEMMFKKTLKNVALIGCISTLSIIGFRLIDRKLHPRHFLASYSQEGEDMILRRFIGKKNRGFFVDVGAHHPIKLSNTYHFYRRGWRGINIDAMPGSMQLFRKLRPEDTNLEVAVGKKEGEVTFYIFEEPAFNTCQSELSKGHSKVEKVQMRPLKEVLKENVPPGQKIDFFSIDVEGLDLEVLESNDWSLFSPQFILVECLKKETVEEALTTPVYCYLKNQGYSLAAKTKNTLCFEKNH
jgi:FkbM family methyltransferase